MQTYICSVVVCEQELRRQKYDIIKYVVRIFLFFLDIGLI